MNFKKTLFPLLALILTFFVAGCGAAPEAPAEDEQPTEITEDASTIDEDAVSVTIFEPGVTSSSLELLGQVTNEANISVAPITNGQLTSVNVQDGEEVKAGEILFVLGGNNGSKHPFITQYESALANYNAAVTGYNTSVKSGQVQVDSAALQLQSAEHQAEAAIIDYQSLGESIETSKDGLALLRTNLSETQLKNERDLANLQESIDDLEDDLQELTLDFDDLIYNAPDDATEAALEDEFEAARDALEMQIEQLEDQYDALESGALLSENQLIAQMNQAESQHHSLYTTVDSTAARLGLDGDSTDQVKLAEQGLEAAKVQSSAAVTQAQTQLDLAELNLETAADQQKMLLVKAPVDGKVDGLSAAVGQSVSPQNVLARIVNSSAFVLEVGVDIENAENLRVGDTARVEIGDKFMESPILSIAPSAGAQSRLVNVRVQLPKIGFRENQSLRVQLPLNAEALNVEGFFVPLDSVIIGSREQFVYIVENGKAKQIAVELGDINGSLVEIVGGELQESDQLIVDGAKDVKNGQTVTIS